MNELEFQISPDKNPEAYIELNKLLKANALVESGSMANQFIVAGEVLVNGSVDTRKRAKIRPGSKVEFQGTIIHVI